MSRTSCHAWKARVQNRVNLFELAYERIEDLIVNCELKPGRFLAIQDLQEMTGFSRTPVRQAVEPFLEHTMRPLHTIFRRIGWIHHNHISGNANVHTTIDCHLAILDAVANRHVAQAMTASDAPIDFVDSMFETMEREIDPSLLDCSLEPLIIRPRKD
jgi:DNA-binding GntR family transcriptional regulator